MKYIRKVQTNDEFDKLQITNTITPSVFLSSESGEVFYSGNKWRNYLTIEALEDGLTVSFSKNACEYCIDKSDEWVELAARSATPAINAGQSISFKAQGLTPTVSNGIGTFTISKKCALTGSCMSMVYGDDASGKTEIVYPYQFYKLFEDASTITQVSRGFLPATTLAEACYGYMFSYCTNLTAAPELPATTLARDCYFLMFQSCISLTTAPELPATTLANTCYRSMFLRCTNLTTAPELPATTLVNSCYYSMFEGCTNLTYIKMMATDISAINCLGSWVQGVASSGTFVKNSAATWDVTGSSGIPSGWTIETADA